MIELAILRICFSQFSYLYVVCLYHVISFTNRIYEIEVNAPLSLSFVQEPFNAEPRRSDLVSSYVTPVEFFYKRNHGPIPIVDDIDKYLHFFS